MFGTRGLMTAIAVACIAIATGTEAQAACALAEGTGTGYSVGHASALAQADAMRKAVGAQGAQQVEFSQPACFYLDDQTARADMVRCTMTVSWCTAPALPRTAVGVPVQQFGPPGTIGIPEPEYRRPGLPNPRLGIPEPGLRAPTLPQYGGGRSCSNLESRATAPSLARARTTAYRSMIKALGARGTQAGAPGVVVHEPACLYADGRNVTCTMSATYCR